MQDTKPVFEPDTNPVFETDANSEVSAASSAADRSTLIPAILITVGPLDCFVADLRRHAHSAACLAAFAASSRNRLAIAACFFAFSGSALLRALVQALQHFMY